MVTFAKYLFTLLLPLLLVATSALAQSAKVQELQQKVKAAASDSDKVFYMVELGYEMLTHDVKAARTIAADAHKLASGTTDKHSRNYALNLLGAIALQESNYEEALKHFLMVLKNSESSGHLPTQATALANIGNVYNKQKLLDKGLEYLERSLQIKLQAGLEKTLASSYLNIASLYAEKRDYETARKHFENALEYAQKFNNLRLQAMIYSNLGVTYRHLNMHEKGLESFYKGIDIRRSLNDLDGLSASCMNLGAALYDNYRYEEAEKMYNEALELAVRMNNKERRNHVYRGLSKVYHKTGRDSLAVVYAVRSIELNDTIYSENSSAQIAKMQAEYESEKRQREIERLRQESLLKQIENEKNQKEIQMLFHQQLAKDLESENKSKEIELLNKQSKLKEIEKAKNLNEIKLLSQDKKFKELELEKNKGLLYVASGVLSIVVLFSLALVREYKSKKKANVELAQKNAIIEEKNSSILSSIQYAKFIQEAMLPSESVLERAFAGHFIFFKPKDIVSGDFYWIEEHDGRVYFAAVDCTGHGVPGAFMSIVGHNGLNQALKERNCQLPSQILNHLNESVNHALRKKNDSSTVVKDGMDLSLCCFDPASSSLSFAAAFNPLWVIKAGATEITEYKGDKKAIGSAEATLSGYTNTTMSVEKGDTIYVFSDGYADQFGGTNGKKFKYRQLKDLLVSIAHLPMDQQKDALSTTLEEWRGDLEQVDDILVMGVRV